MSNPRFIFFGSPRFAALVLKGLVKSDLKPELVICNPDRPAGRKQIMHSPETKVLAKEHGIPVFQPETLPPVGGWPIDLKEMDFALVAAYAKILPKEIIEAPKMGTLGLHPSWLPKYRGASPIQEVILNGEEKTAVVIYQMDEKLDHGPTLYGVIVDIEDENYLELEEKLAREGAKALIKAIPQFMAGALEPKEQDHKKASFTKKLETFDGEIDIVSADKTKIYRRVRALNPEPGVYTFTFPGREGKRVKILEARMDANELLITKIKPEGKGEMAVEQKL